MPRPQTTSWNLIQRASAGDATARGTFASQYEQLVREYLLSRWQGSPLREQTDDAVQDVFVECFREKGVLDTVEAGRPGGFRAFLYGAVRNVGLRHERDYRTKHEKQLSSTLNPHVWPSPESTLSRQFDRAWAVSILHRAVELLSDRANEKGEDARSRVEILRLRFDDDLPIRDIAKMWNTDSVQIHRQYQKARKEFRAALREVLSGDYKLTDQELERELGELADLLGKS